MAVKVETTAAQPGDAACEGRGHGEVRRAGLAASVAPGIAYAALSAAGIVGTAAFVQVFSGSYLAWPIVLSALAFWCAAAAAAGLALAVALTPVLVAVKGRLRPVIMPGIIVAAGCAAILFIMKDDLAVREPLAGGLLLHWAFLAGMAGVMGFTAAGLAAKETRRRWPVILVFLAAPLAAAGTAFFVPSAAAALTFAVGPVLAAALSTAVMDRVPRKRVVALSAIALLGAALVATGYANGKPPLGPIDGRSGADPAKAAMLAGKPNVIIIVLDTVRADHTSLCGYKYPTTPNLEKLAKDAWLFPHGESVDSWTLPAHASLFTGLYPREHGAHASSGRSVRNMEGFEPYGIPLAPSKKTLAWFLSRLGYSTGGIAANYTWLCRQFGMDQGFDYYYDLPRMLLFQPASAPVFKYPSRKDRRCKGHERKAPPDVLGCGERHSDGALMARTLQGRAVLSLRQLHGPALPLLGSAAVRRDTGRARAGRQDAQTAPVPGAHYALHQDWRRARAGAPSLDGEPVRRRGRVCGPLGRQNSSTISRPRGSTKTLSSSSRATTESISASTGCSITG